MLSTARSPSIVMPFAVGLKISNTSELARLFLAHQHRQGMVSYFLIRPGAPAVLAQAVMQLLCDASLRGTAGAGKVRQLTGKSSALMSYNQAAGYLGSGTCKNPVTNLGDR